MLRGLYTNDQKKELGTLLVSDDRLACSVLSQQGLSAMRGLVLWCAGHRLQALAALSQNIIRESSWRLL